MEPRESLEFFGNFFTKFYLLHPFDEEVQKKLTSEDQTKLIAYTIIFGAFTLGFAHLVCWIAEKCVKPADIANPVIKTVDAAGRNAIDQLAQNTGEKPALGEEKPADAGGKPVEDARKKPALGEEKPADAGGKPAEDAGGKSRLQREEPQGGKGANDVPRPEKKLKKPSLSLLEHQTQQMKNALSHPNVAKFIDTGASDRFFKRSTLYEQFKFLKEKLSKENLTSEEIAECVPLYQIHEGRLKALEEASEEKWGQVVDKLKDECIFNLLRSDLKEITTKVKGLKDLEKGKFKTNMEALLQLISSLKEVPLSPSVEEDLEASVIMNEQAVDAAVGGYDDLGLAFADFENRLKEEGNQAAREGFLACKDIFLPGGAIDRRLSTYQEAENKTQILILSLQKPLQDLSSEEIFSKPDVLTGALNSFNEAFASVPHDMEKPSLLHLLLQVPHTTKAFLHLKTIKNSRPELKECSKALQKMRIYLGATGKERLNFVIDLGKNILKNPEDFFDKYLTAERVLQFEGQPKDSIKVITFLKKIRDDFHSKEYSAEDLLALEAFTAVTLCVYTTDPACILDPNFKAIRELLEEIREFTRIKMHEDPNKGELEKLRKTELNQNFYKRIKEKIENIPHYPKDFWLDPRAAKRLKIEDRLLRTLGMKIADPTMDLSDQTELVHENKHLGYEIYFYKSENEDEKPKLLIVYTKEPSYASLQQMNHQLGLFGDGTILQSAEDVISNMTSTEVLEGYHSDLKAGNVDMIALGFGNGGAAAAIVANRMAVIYPKAQVTSIAAGSTTMVTTEEAYNMNKADNFFSIRLKYIKDGNVDRQLGSYTGDFSEDSYKTFPLLVSYSLKTIDTNRHNKEEYGNIDNFIPAMRNPILLRNIYQELVNEIVYAADIPVSPDSAMDLDSIDDSFMVVEKPLNIGSLDDLIALGGAMLDRPQDYEGAFLKLDQQKMTVFDKKKELEQLEKKEGEEPGFFRGWFSGSKKGTQQPVQMSILLPEEQENTIHTLQHTIAYLRKPEVLARITPEKAFSLLFAADMLLINYTKINTNVGKYPQMVDLIYQMKELVGERLDVLSQNETTKEGVLRLFQKRSGVLDDLSNRVKENPFYKDLFAEDILKKVDFEDLFLEFLGFKIAAKGKEKIGSDVYSAKLLTEETHQYDISLFSPEDLNKKQRLVICCNGIDALGNHGLLTKGDFGAGDKAIFERVGVLQPLVIKQLKELFSKHHISQSDVEIVVTGFGSEGAVATALGYYLSKEFEKQGGQVKSVAFGAPRFTTLEGAGKIRNRGNFIPIRFLSPTDTRHEWKMQALADYPVSDQTYYTVPFGFRVVGLLEMGGHTPNLYGDVQGIRSSMRSAYQLREVSNEKRRYKTEKKATEEELKEVVGPFKRIMIDTQKETLRAYSHKTIKEIKKLEPGKLIRTMKYCVDLSEKEDLSPEKIEVIQRFFKVFMEAIKNDDINENHSIENEFCKKMFNHGYKPNQLFGGKWRLQRMLSKDLADAMDAVEASRYDVHSKAHQELLLRRSYCRGVLAGDLNGNRYKPAGGGVNGAVFFRQLESGLKSPLLLPDEISYVPFLGVFKPHPLTVREFKGYLDMTQAGERAKAVGGMDSHLNKEDPDCRVHNEVFAYELFHIFDFFRYIGFPTTLKFINKNDAKGRPASFCAFIPGLDIVGSHVASVTKKQAKSNTLDEKRMYSQEELYIWQMSKIFDFLTGNMDGHEGNAFVKVNDKRELVGAVNFDYDKAFAINHTPRIGNQYKWAQLRISKKLITQKTRDALAEMLKDPDGEAKVQAFLNKAREGGSNNFTKAQENLLRERIEVLKKVADGTIQRLSQLADYKGPSAP